MDQTSSILVGDEATEESFIKVGRLLNSHMQYRDAGSCFLTALRLIQDKYHFTQGNITSLYSNTQVLESDITLFCEALSCAVETLLHTNETESARDVLYDHNMATVFDLSQCTDSMDLINWTLGSLYLSVGNAYIKAVAISTAKTILEKGKEHLLLLSHEEARLKSAELLAALGFCHLCGGNLDEANNYQIDAIEMWRKLSYPLYQIELCINTMKHYIDCRLRSASPSVDEHNVCTDMLRLHNALWNHCLDTQVPEAFTYLGMVAFHKEKETTALAFFEEALALYKKMPCNEENRDSILKLLRDVGVASYNCRNFSKAAEVYKECLDMLRQSSPVNITKLGQIAECCAALGFTFSRLRNFDKMLEYYEKALELQARLVSEDLELIETNIGSLYHVKAVLCESEGDEPTAKRYFAKAESAFTKALRYSWKSFPFINYGYYLLCRGDYVQATHMLQQGYLNGVVDKDTVEFDHTEDPILIQDLRRELQDCEDIRMPSTVIALYLKAVSQSRVMDITGAGHTANQLRHEIQICRFDAYYTEGFGLERMKALCYSLLGCVYRDLGQKTEARVQFERSLEVLPDYKPAASNLRVL